MSAQGNFSQRRLRFVERLSLRDGADVSRVQLAVAGTWNHDGYGLLEITRDDLVSMQRNLQSGRRAVKDENGEWQLNIDYNHGGLSLGPEQAKAAGWLKARSVAVENKALYGDIHWTPTAAAYIRNKEYQYFSPEVRFHYNDKETAEDIGSVLLAGALTNRPFLEGPAWMSPIILGEGVPSPMILAPTSQKPIHSIRGEENAVAKAKMDEQKLRALLDVGQAESLEDAIVALKEQLGALEEERASLTEQVAALEASRREDVSLTEFEQLKGQNAQMAKRLSELSTELKQRECDETIRKALEAGKIVPAAEEWARGYCMSDPEGFAQFVESVPQVVPFAETGSSESPAEDPIGAFTDRCKQLAAERRVSFADAMLLCEKEEPELFAAYSRAQRQA